MTFKGVQARDLRAQGFTQLIPVREGSGDLGTRPKIQKLCGDF